MQDVIENLIFAAGMPVSFARLADILKDYPAYSDQALEQALQALAEKYRDAAIEFKHLASGYCMQTNPRYAPWIQKLFEEKPRKYSQAMLEVLAIIAYEGPITRAEIEQKRGVAVAAGMMKSFLEREWIYVCGHRDTPGRPALYATSNQFLDYFNLASLDQLPPIKME